MLHLHPSKNPFRETFCLWKCFLFLSSAAIWVAQTVGFGGGVCRVQRDEEAAWKGDCELHYLELVNQAVLYLNQYLNLLLTTSDIWIFQIFFFLCLEAPKKKKEKEIFFLP